MLTEELPALLSSISFKRSMRWGAGPDVAFSRPVRWLLALHGDTALPVAWAGLRGGAATRVLRNAAAPELKVGSRWTARGCIACSQTWQGGRGGIPC